MGDGLVTRPSRDRAGDGSVLWYLARLPFMILRVVPHTGELLRHEAATTTGERAQAGGAELSPADDRATVAAVLAEITSRDPGFDLPATTRGVVRAREAVDMARQASDASSARPVMSDGLWRVFALLLQTRTAHRVHRQATSVIIAGEIVAATRDQLAEQLRVRLTCQGERQEFADGIVLRGQTGQQTWQEDWTVRRSAIATTPAGGGVLSGQCPNCGAVLSVSADGGCAYCGALVLTGGQDWVVWSIEEAPW
jgi:Tim44-like domain